MQKSNLGDERISFGSLNDEAVEKMIGNDDDADVNAKDTAALDQQSDSVG